MRFFNNDDATGGPVKPGHGELYVYILLIAAVIMAFLLTGGTPPSDPNGPYGPPSIPPGWDPEKDGKQSLVYPAEVMNPDPHGKLQLKTFKINACLDKIAVNFLVDTSGSFAYDGKMDNMKESLRSFTDRMSNYSVIGMQTFSGVVSERVPLDYYKNQKIQVKATIDNLEPQGNTRTRDGFKLAQKLIMQAKEDKKFEGYQYVLVLMTDGIPEMHPTQKRTCIGPEIADPLTAPALRCFAREQDPRVPTNIPDELKANGVRIFSVGIYSPNRPSDAAFQPRLEALLQEVASQPYQDHYYSSVHGGNLEEILDNLFNKICK